MNKCPCEGCQNCGCGAYHDVCPEYQAFNKRQQEIRIKMKLHKMGTTADRYNMVSHTRGTRHKQKAVGGVW